MSLQTGTVKFFNPTGGYGFIASDGGGHDVFFHVLTLPPGVKPAQGQKVKFTLGLDGNGRPRAATVIVLGK